MKIKHLFSWKHLREYIWPSMGYKRFGKYVYFKILNTFTSPFKLALGAAIGAFWGMTPLLGFHNIFTFIVAIISRSNWFVALIICNILASPIGIPLIFSADYAVGRFILRTSEPFHFARITHFKYLIHHFLDLFLPLLVGGLILGILAFTIVFTFFYFTSKLYQQQRQHKKQSKRLNYKN